MKKIIIESLISSQKTAILEDDKLSEIFIEDNKKSKIVDNIYRGVVKKVLPGIEACFIDVGFDKLAYLQLKKDSNIKAGQDILVQINKEEIGTKGAKLNLEISLAGRYLVYIPSNDRITISNKIKDEKERFRLKKIAKSIMNGESGLIIRTEAVSCSREELENDIKELKVQYESILKEYKLGIGPKLLYKGLDFSAKYVKNNVNDDVELIVTNNINTYEDLKYILNNINKDFQKKLIIEENKDVFDLYRINEQLDKALNKKVWLKSGGYLIIEKTEALTVVDVNTGKFIGSSKLQDTVYKTNIEASKEIARQLKLRDIGGIIIIDFIDMNNKKDKEELLRSLEQELQKDKRKTEVLGMTRLGLVEVARRREKEGIDSFYLDKCNECSQDGYIKSINYMLDIIEKEVMRISEHTSYKNITVEVNQHNYNQITKNYMNIINQISQKYGIIMNIDANNKINYEKININYNS